VTHLLNQRIGRSASPHPFASAQAFAFATYRHFVDDIPVLESMSDSSKLLISGVPLPSSPISQHSRTQGITFVPVHSWHLLL